MNLLYLVKESGGCQPGRRRGSVIDNFNLDSASAKLTPASVFTLDEVADVLINHPEKRRVRVEARWDTTIPPSEMIAYVAISLKTRAFCPRAEAV